MTTESKLAEALAGLEEIKARTQGRVYVHRYVTDDAEVARVFSDDIPLLIAGLEESELLRSNQRLALDRLKAERDSGREILESTDLALRQAIARAESAESRIAQASRFHAHRSCIEAEALADRTVAAESRAEAAEGELAKAAESLDGWGVGRDSVGRGLRYRIGLMGSDLEAAHKSLAQSEAEVARLRGDLEAIAGAWDEGLSAVWMSKRASDALSAARPKGDDAVAAPPTPVLCRCCGVDRSEMLDCLCSIQTYKGAECCDTHQRVIGKPEGR